MISMNTRTTQFIHISRTAYVAAFVLLSVFISLAIQAPTHALTVDLGKTVTNVTNNIPIVKDVTPLLIGSPAPTVMVAPQTTTSRTTTQPTTQANEPATTETLATTTTGPSANTTAASNLRTSASSLSAIPTGLSVEAKQSEIAAAPAHAASPAVMYTSRSLSSETASIIFYLGVAGVLFGAGAIYLMRPKMATA